MEMAVEIQTNHADDPKSKSQRLNEPTLIPYFLKIFYTLASDDMSSIIFHLINLVEATNDL